jgi:hypothetical protein
MEMMRESSYYLSRGKYSANYFESSLKCLKKLGNNGWKP